MHCHLYIWFIYFIFYLTQKLYFWYCLEIISFSILSVLIVDLLLLLISLFIFTQKLNLSKWDRFLNLNYRYNTKKVPHASPIHEVKFPGKTSLKKRLKKKISIKEHTFGIEIFVKLFYFPILWICPCFSKERSSDSSISNENRKVFYAFEFIHFYVGKFHWFFKWAFPVFKNILCV